MRVTFRSFIMKHWKKNEIEKWKRIYDEEEKNGFFNFSHYKKLFTNWKRKKQILRRELYKSVMKSTAHNSTWLS